MKYSVIIPVYNGELTIEELAKQLIAFFQSEKFDFEIIFVCDCGKDKSWEIIKKLKNKNENIKGIRLSRNFGQHNAIICGIKHAQGDFVITMDEDLQHSPSDIIKLINKQKDNDFDVVYGKYNEKQHAVHRNITSSILKRLLSFSIPDLHQDYSSFRLIKYSVVIKTIELNNSYTFLDGYLTWITTNVGSIEITHYERFAGESSYNLKKLSKHALNIFITFSAVPIRFLTIMSFFIFVVFSIYASYLIIRKILFNDLFTGYASTMILLGMGFALILFGLGIIGEYLHRINLKTTKKPNFFEGEIL